MTVQDNKRFIERYLAAMSGTNKAPEVVDEFVSDSDQDLKDHIAAFEAAFPLYEVKADDILAEKDKVVVRATFKGTHQRELMGIAATNKEVIMPVMLIYRIVEDKITEHWMSVDQLTLMQQLGAIPTMNQATA